MKIMIRNLLTTAIIVIASVQVQGQEIKRWKINELLEYIEKSDSALVINFWATFCAPCIEEIPYFQTISKQYASNKVKLLLVNLDFKEYYPDKIAGFAKKHDFTAEIVWLDEEKPDQFCPMIDKTWSGAMPATLFSNKVNGYRKFFESQMNAERFEAQLIHLTGLQCPASLPAYTGLVNDFEELFSPAEKAALTTSLKKLYTDKTAQVVVVTTSSFAPFDAIWKYAFYIGQCWGLGDKKKDDGLVILICKKERKTWIANGDGIESRLSDAETKKIVQQFMLPAFKKGSYFRGTADAIRAIHTRLKIKK